MPADTPTEATEHARRTGERAAGIIRTLMSEVDRLHERLRYYERLEVGPAPDPANPAHRVWAALMEDLRDDGVVRMTIHTETRWVVGYEPVITAASTPLQAGT